MKDVEIIICDGSLTAVADNPQYLALARGAAAGYKYIINDNLDLLDDEIGKCSLAAQVILSVARKLRIKAHGWCGEVRGARTPEAPNKHYWVDLGDNLIIDSPSYNKIVLGTPEQRGYVYEAKETFELSELL